MKIERGDFNALELERIEVYGHPDSALLPNTTSGIYRKLYNALPQAHPFKKNDVVYYCAAAESPRLVQRAYFVKGEAVVDALGIDGWFVEGIEVSFYSKEISS